MIRKLIHIIIGWSRRLGWIETTAAESKLSDLRMKSCSNCKESFESKFLKIVSGHAEYEKVIVCGKCKCPCLAKTLVVDEQCPLNKW